ncbi:cation diffusion facilitator family transporter [Levilactobacillus tangyuanensis]|uniref:Cation diffusion facilitator family transporter n=1 Tax=Levilactobacillus tangyuanensis TaxID=2486021 RepID=A0ABW1TP48_9LACO|nr:cation diffusion facilitator family transporter [Levilactobacillus tangyuanensis]
MMKDTNQDWQHVQQTVVANLNLANRHLWENAGIYLSLFLVEDLAAWFGHSQVLRADALNNLSGIFSTSLLMTGLYIAGKTRDNDLWGAPIAAVDRPHVGPRTQQSRFRFETIYTLLAGIMMVFIAADILFETGHHLIWPSHEHLQPLLSGAAAAASGLLLTLLWWSNRRWAHQLKNTALAAAAKDTFTDVLTSLVTLFTIVGVGWFHINWIDGAASFALGLYILFVGIQIFRQCALKLVDYFDPRLEAAYQQAVADLPAVQRVLFIKAYYDGNLIMVSVTIAVNPNMTAATIYQLTQTINQLLHTRYGVTETALMVMPADRAFVKKGSADQPT